MIMQVTEARHKRLHTLYKIHVILKEGWRVAQVECLPTCLVCTEPWVPSTELQRTKHLPAKSHQSTDIQVL